MYRRAARTGRHGLGDFRQTGGLGILFCPSLGRASPGTEKSLSLRTSTIKSARFDLGSNYFGGNDGGVILSNPTQLNNTNCAATDRSQDFLPHAGRRRSK